MSRIHVTLALSLMAAGCQCAMSSAEAVHEENGRRVRIGVEHRAGIGVGAIGAPHAFGILHPTWEDSGIRIVMNVDERPAVLVGHAPQGEVEAIASAVEVAVSKDGAHVAARYQGPWVVFHLLPNGTPFDAPGSQVDAEQVDFAAFGTPEDIAVALLSDPDQGHGASWELFFEAVAAQDPSPRVDRALLLGWPDGRRHREVVGQRLAHPNATEALREDVFERAKDAVARYEAVAPSFPLDRQAELAVFGAFAKLGPERLAWLDERIVTRWEAPEELLPSRLASFMSSRLRSRGPFEGCTRMAAPLRARAAAASRRWLTAGLVRDGVLRELGRNEGTVFLVLVEWVALEGTPEDARWLHELLLASWPHPGSLRHVHVAVLNVVRGELGVPDPDWRRRALEAAEAALETEYLHDGLTLLLELGAPPPSLERAFDAAIERGGIVELGLVKRHHVRASEAWRRDAVRRILAMPEPASSAPYEARHRHGNVRELGFELALAVEDCAALDALAPNGLARERIPASCPRSP